MLFFNNIYLQVRQTTASHRRIQGTVNNLRKELRLFNAGVNSYLKLLSLPFGRGCVSNCT